MALLKQIKFGSVSTPIAMTQVAINSDSENVLKVVGTHTDLTDANDPVYTIALAVDGKTILKGSTGLETALALRVKAADGTTSKKARIAMVDHDEAELSSVNIEDIVGNGVITETAYDPTTGELTITWAGGSKTVVNLGKLLDIDDVAIESASQKYLKVELNPEASETGGSQAVFGAKIVKVAEATGENTGLVDAKDVKDYVDNAATGLAVKAKGDDYITAGVDAEDNKQINVTADVQALTATAGTVGVYDAEGKETTVPVKSSLSGTANSLVDGADVATKVTTYVDGAIAIEIARADAQVLAAVKALDAEVGSTTVDNGKHVAVQVVETDGKLTGLTVTENDIASADALTAEIAARKAVDGQNGDAYVAKADANYIREATSLHDADVKLDAALKAEVNRAKAAEQEIATKVGLTDAEGSRTFTPTTNYGGASATVMANMQAIDTKLKEVEGTLAGVQYKVYDTTLEFFGITDQNKA